MFIVRKAIIKAMKICPSVIILYYIYINLFSLITLYIRFDDRKQLTTKFKGVYNKTIYKAHFKHI